MKPAKTYYDEFSRTYERGRARGYHALIDELELEVARRYVRGRVLELGCGTGLILSPLSQMARAVGMDLSSGMLRKAHERGLCVLQASAPAFPFRDQSFDTVCSFKVLAHVPAIRDTLQEVARVLRPGGHAVLEFYNRRSLRYLAFRIRRGSISAQTTEKDVFTRYDRLEDMRSYLPDSLKIVDMRGVRVVTPHAALHRVPGVAALLRATERRLARAPLLRRLGGFLVLVVERVGV